MSKKEIQALRRPFLKELFRDNKFNLAMTVIAALLGLCADADRLGARPDVPLQIPCQGDAAIPQICL